jgi:endonuclease/exonuclease/phosphatase family metal-dependent hydrolase
MAAAPVAAAAAERGEDEVGRCLTVLTYNVWFAPDDFERRAALLFEQIAESRADVVALQEVTDAFLHFLKGSRLLRHPPASTDNDDDDDDDDDGHHHAEQYELMIEPGLGPLKPYGTVLLSRWPTESVTHQPFTSGDMDRGLLACVVKLPMSAGQRPLAIAVGTTHLESPEGEGAKDNFRERRAQCAAALNSLRALEADSGAQASVLLGDFNGTRGADEEAFVTPPFRDAWLELQQSDPGYTYDAVRNPNARVYQSRLDKVVFADGAVDGVDCCTELTVARAELVGVIPDRAPKHTDPLTTPPPPPPPLLHASDHYGLLVEFAIIERPQDKLAAGNKRAKVDSLPLTD